MVMIKLKRLHSTKCGILLSRIPTKKEKGGIPLKGGISTKKGKR